MPKNLNLRQLGLTALLLILVAVLETKAAIGAFKSVSDPLAAAQYSALSIVCAILAFVFSAIAGNAKHDIRPHVREIAIWARAVSLACLLIPIGTLASAMKHDREVTEWPAYRASPAYAIDVATAAAEVDLLDNVAIQNREAAQERIQEPRFSSASITDVEFWYALFLQAIVITGAGIRLSAPATIEEIKHERAVLAGKKAAATRERNRLKREAKKKAQEPKKPLFGLIQGGKPAKA